MLPINIMRTETSRRKFVKDIMNYLAGGLTVLGLTNGCNRDTETKCSNILSMPQKDEDRNNIFSYKAPNGNFYQLGIFPDTNSLTLSLYSKGVTYTAIEYSGNGWGDIIQDDGKPVYLKVSPHHKLPRIFPIKQETPKRIKELEDIFTDAKNFSLEKLKAK